MNDGLKALKEQNPEWFTVTIRKSNKKLLTRKGNLAGFKWNKNDLYDMDTGLLVMTINNSKDITYMNPNYILRIV